MKNKIIFALFVFASLRAMEDQKCEIAFYNDLDGMVTINDDCIKPTKQRKLILSIGKSAVVKTVTPFYYSTSSVCSLFVPIIKDDNKSKFCAVALSFLIHAKKDSTCDAPNNSNMALYFLQVK